MEHALAFRNAALAGGANATIPVLYWETAMALTVRFSKDTTTLRLPAPSPGSLHTLAKEQAAGLSAAGQRYVYDKGVDRRALALKFPTLTTAQKDALASFFDSTADGMMQTFTYTDADGTAWTARFASPDLAVQRVREDEWSVALQLEVS